MSVLLANPSFYEAKTALRKIQVECKEKGKLLVGVFNGGGHGDKMVNIACARALRRHLAATRFPDKPPIHLCSICTKSNTPIDKEAYYGTEPWIDSTCLIASQYWQQMFLEFKDDFDLFMSCQYTVNFFTTNYQLFWPMVVENLANTKLFTTYWTNFPAANNALSGTFHFSQWDLMSLTAGFPITPADLHVDTEPVPTGVRRILREAAGQKFITIHAGQGGHGVTKCLLPESVAAIVAKATRMGYKVVQIGAAKDRIIPGTINLLQSSLQGSAAAMKAGALHVDNEGFLPYVGRAIGKRCLTFMGPTAPWFFHFGPEPDFPGHYFHTTSRCMPCWWCNSTWMEMCPKRLESCVNLPSPIEAARAVERALLDQDYPKGSGFVGEGNVLEHIAAPLIGSYVPEWMRTKQEAPSIQELSRNEKATDAETWPTDYSRWGEQEAILKFFAGKVDGSFLDIGAFDGVTESNTRALAELGWSGVCVEANPRNFSKLLDNLQGLPRVKALCAAISVEESPSTFNESIHAECGTAAEANLIGKDLVASYGVGSVTASQLAEKFGTSWDFISLDVEGLDRKILPTLIPLLKGTSLLCIEVVKPNQGFSADYKADMLEVAGWLGFDKVVLETVDEKGCPRNVLLARSKDGVT